MAIQVGGTTVISNNQQLTSVNGLKTVGGTSILGTGDISVGGGFPWWQADSIPAVTTTIANNYNSNGTSTAVSANNNTGRYFMGTITRNSNTIASYVYFSTITNSWAVCTGTQQNYNYGAAYGANNPASSTTFANFGGSTNNPGMGNCIVYGYIAPGDVITHYKRTGVYLSLWNE
jgi:hypothetical protein